MSALKQALEMTGRPKEGVPDKRRKKEKEYNEDQHEREHHEGTEPERDGKGVRQRRDHEIF